MARPKPKPEGAATPPKRQPTAVTIRGSKEWREWLDRGADHCLTDVAKLIDVSVTRYLQAQGFEEPRPKR
jgi:hypothetical protein